MSAAILVALISFLGCSIAAQAHQINLTNARLVVLPDRTVDVEIAMKGSDADRAAGTKVFDDAAGLVQPAVLAAASAPIAACSRYRSRSPGPASGSRSFLGSQPAYGTGYGQPSTGQASTGQPSAGQPSAGQPANGDGHQHGDGPGMLQAGEAQG